MLAQGRRDAPAPRLRHGRHAVDPRDPLPGAHEGGHARGLSVEIREERLTRDAVGILREGRQENVLPFRGEAEAPEHKVHRQSHVSIAPDDTDPHALRGREGLGLLPDHRVELPVLLEAALPEIDPEV